MVDALTPFCFEARGILSEPLFIHAVEAISLRLSLVLRQVIFIHKL
jgi:hypothetical protein